MSSSTRCVIFHISFVIQCNLIQFNVFKTNKSSSPRIEIRPILNARVGEEQRRGLNSAKGGGRGGRGTGGVIACRRRLVQTQRRVISRGREGERRQSGALEKRLSAVKNAGELLLVCLARYKRLLRFQEGEGGAPPPPGHAGTLAQSE